MLNSGRLLRLLACLLIAGLSPIRASHGSHASLPPANHDLDCDHSTGSDDSHHPDPSSTPAHDSDHCQICHFIATGSAAIAAARQAILIAGPLVEMRISPIVAEPHSADTRLPCAARAPPVSIHAA